MTTSSVKAEAADEARAGQSRFISLSTVPPSALWSRSGSPTPVLPAANINTTPPSPALHWLESSREQPPEQAVYCGADSNGPQTSLLAPSSAITTTDAGSAAVRADDATNSAEPQHGSQQQGEMMVEQQTGPEDQQKAQLSTENEGGESETDWKGIQEVEMEAMAAGQQLARDNSSALREVRRAMQNETDKQDARDKLNTQSQQDATEKVNAETQQQVQELQVESSLWSIQEVELEALAAGQQLAVDNSQALREVKQQLQEVQQGGAPSLDCHHSCRAVSVLQQWCSG